MQGLQLLHAVLPAMDEMSLLSVLDSALAAARIGSIKIQKIREIRISDKCGFWGFYLIFIKFWLMGWI